MILLDFSFFFQLTITVFIRLGTFADFHCYLQEKKHFKSKTLKDFDIDCILHFCFNSNIVQYHCRADVVKDKIVFIIFYYI